MNKETLIRQLEAIGVPSWRYSLVCDNNPDCTSVVGIGNKWSVVYTDDRGIKNLITEFNSREDDTIIFIVTSFVSRISKRDIV